MFQFAFETLTDLRVVVSRQGTTHPTDAEWDAYVNAVRNLSDEFRFLVLTDGSAPSPSQRARLFAAVRGRRVRVAVVTASVAARFVLSVIALVNPNVRSYLPSQMDEAFAYIGLDSEGRARVEAVLRRLSGKTEHHLDQSVA